MKISQFINIHRVFSLQNIGKDSFTDADYSQKVYDGLIDIYHRLSNTGVWFYNAVEEIGVVQTVGSPGQYRSAHPILRMWGYTDVNGKWVEEGVVVGTTSYEFVPFFWSSVSGTNRYTFLSGTPSQDGTIVGVKSKSDLTMTLRYFRAPNKINTGTLAEEDLDIPSDLIGALHEYVSSCILPASFYETGASLSNFYMGRYLDKLNNYAASYGANIKTNLIFK